MGKSRFIMQARKVYLAVEEACLVLDGNIPPWCVGSYWLIKHLHSSRFWLLSLGCLCYIEVQCLSGDNLAPSDWCLLYVRVIRSTLVNSFWRWECFLSTSDIVIDPQTKQVSRAPTIQTFKPNCRLNLGPSQWIALCIHCGRLQLPLIPRGLVEGEIIPEIVWGIRLKMRAVVNMVRPWARGCLVLSEPPHWLEYRRASAFSLVVPVGTLVEKLSRGVSEGRFEGSPVWALIIRLFKRLRLGLSHVSCTCEVGCTIGKQSHSRDMVRYAFKKIVKQSLTFH